MKTENITNLKSKRKSQDEKNKPYLVLFYLIIKPPMMNIKKNDRSDKNELELIKEFHANGGYSNIHAEQIGKDEIEKNIEFSKNVMESAQVLMKEGATVSFNFTIHCTETNKDIYHACFDPSSSKFQLPETLREMKELKGMEKDVEALNKEAVILKEKLDALKKRKSINRPSRVFSSMAGKSLWKTKNLTMENMLNEMKEMGFPSSKRFVDQFPLETWPELIQIMKETRKKIDLFQQKIMDKSGKRLELMLSPGF